MLDGPTFQPFPGRPRRGFVVFMQPTDKARYGLDSAEYFLGHDRLEAATGGQHERILYAEDDQGQAFCFWEFPGGVPEALTSYIDAVRAYYC
jgi:hypothetical protein